jgi:dipeptidyl aminopeptidase/acylaminoacyl peptidase
MTRIRIALAALSLLLSAAAFAQTHPLAFEDMMAMKRVGGPQLSPDGQWIVYDASTIDLKANVRHSAIYLIASSGGPSKQITDGVKQDEGPAWSPDGKTIAYVSNRDTPAKQVWLYDLASGQSRRLTNLQGGAGSLKWAPDGSAIFLVSDIYPECGVDPVCIKEKTDAEGAAPTKARVITSLLYRHWTAWQSPTRTHVVYFPLGGSGTRDLTPGTFDAPPFSLGGGDEFDVSPDGRELVYARNTDPHPELSTNSDLFLVATAGGEAKRITTRAGADTSPKYSPDGRWIAWRSQSRAGYESDLWELWLYDRSSGKTTRLMPQFDNWAESYTWASDSRSIYFVAPEKGHEVIYQVAVTSGVPEKLGWGAGSADAVTPSRDGKSIFYSSSSLTTPSRIEVMTRTSSGARSVALTHDNDALLSSIAFGGTQDYWYAGAAGAQVQALMVLPPGFDKTKKYPAIVLVHGGPQGAWDYSWSYRWNPQMYAARGYIVFMPNPRGSTGYGQKFVAEISGDWGGKAFTDIMNGVEALATMPFVDGSRLGAAGASYGGYMVDWLLGHTDRFKALVSHAGVYDLRSEHGVTEELWFPEWEFGGAPWEKPDVYAKWSPDNYVANFKTPTLVSQGELDFRVPVNQGLELFTALQRRGIPSKLMVFPDEGHWVLKPQNSKLFYQTVLDWFDQWLKNPA